MYLHVTSGCSTQFLMDAAAFSAPHSIMEEGWSSVYAVSDELDESSLSSESELEVEQPSQEDQLDQLSLFLGTLMLQLHQTWHKSVKSVLIFY